jgi:ABC-type Fe3+-hydroxamate transport system substrate-binding protein
VEDVEPLTYVQKDGYVITADLFGNKFALVPKDQNIPREVSRNFQKTSIIRTPVEKLVVTSGTYDPGIIFALGKGETIIGSSDLVDEYVLPEMRDLYLSGHVKFVGLYNALDYETIISLKPDVILTSNIQAVEDLNYIGFPVVGTYFEANSSIRSYLELLIFFGVLYDVRDVAETRVARIEQALDDIRAKVGPETKPTFTWGTYWGKQVFVLSSGYWLAELMTLCGGEYVFKGVVTGSTAFSLEEFVTRSRNADIYFANYGHTLYPQTVYDLLLKYPDLAETRPFSKEGIVAVTEKIVWQDSGHLDNLALDLAAFFHPSVYPQVTEYHYLSILKEKGVNRNP